MVLCGAVHAAHESQYEQRYSLSVGGDYGRRLVVGRGEDAGWESELRVIMRGD